jgi:hypothetical protein
VIGYDRRIDLVGQRPEPREVVVVDRIDRADRERHTVQHDRPALADVLQHAPRIATGDQEVLADHLPPVDPRLTRDDLLVVRRAKPEPEAKTRKHGHPQDSQDCRD